MALLMANLDVNKVIEHLRVRWSGRPCQMCGVGNWNVQNSIYQLLQFNQGAVVIGGPVIPVIPVTCNNCGNTVLVNAITAGLLTVPEGKP
jgi:hypothetical protein